MERLSRTFGSFRWAFVPMGLLAVIAVGIHAAADVVDDTVLRGVEWLDAIFDSFFARFELTHTWVDAIDAYERTVMARGLALTWELLVQAFIALPALGFDDQRLSAKELLREVNRRPLPMALLRPLLTMAFVVAGAYQVSVLTESTLFVGLVGDVARPAVASWVARVAGGTAMLVVLVSCAWRAGLRALQHALELSRTSKHPYLAGIMGTVLALPLVVALVVHMAGSFAGKIIFSAGNMSQQSRLAMLFATETHFGRDESRPYARFVTANTGVQRIAVNVATRVVTANTETQRIAADAAARIVTANTETQRIAVNAAARVVTANTETQRIAVNAATRVVLANTGAQCIAVNDATRVVTANTETQRIAVNAATRFVTANTETQRIAVNAAARIVTANTDARFITTNADAPTVVGARFIAPAVQAHLVAAGERGRLL